MTRSLTSRPLLLLASLALLAAALLAAIRSVPAAASPESRLGTLQRKIGAAEHRRDRHLGRERVLASDVAAWSRRIARLQGRIDTLQRRQDGVQSSLDREQGELDRIQTRLRRERSRLVRLRARLVEARRVLSQRLVELYQSDRPDMVTVVMNSDGFADLVQRGEFLDRIGRQDRAVVLRVRAARTEAEATAARLARLEGRQATVTGRIRQQRDAIAGVKGQLVGVRGSYRASRQARNRLLRKTRESRKEAQEHLSEFRREEQQIQEKLARSMGAGPIRRGNGPFVWPLNGTLTSPWCESRSWESCHPGIDIARPTGTPIRAADAGVVALAGAQGGYGNFTCIKHSARLTSCYGHQSRISVRVGQRVSQGQVIGRVGSTGFSTGPHLHFEVRVNGKVSNPMAYL